MVVNLAVPHEEASACCLKERGSHPPKRGLSVGSCSLGGLSFSGVRDLDSGAVMKLAAVGHFTTCADGRKVKGMVQGV